MGKPNYENLPNRVGRYLKHELWVRGITQEEFADQIHVSDRTVRRWVSGDIHSLDSVQLIANALQINAGDIFSEDVPFPFALVYYKNSMCQKEANDERQFWRLFAFFRTA